MNDDKTPTIEERTEWESKIFSVERATKMIRDCVPKFGNGKFTTSAAWKCMLGGIRLSNEVERLTEENKGLEEECGRVNAESVSLSCKAYRHNPDDDTYTEWRDVATEMTKDVERLQGLAYLCPPNPPTHDGQTWRDWAGQLEKGVAEALGVDLDTEGTSSLVPRIKAMREENTKLIADRNRLINEVKDAEAMANAGGYFKRDGQWFGVFANAIKSKETK